MYCEMISDMTKGNPLKLIISFSVPMLIGNIFQQVYNFVDAAIVGKFVGAESLAAVGSTGTIVGVMICLMMGLTSGAGIIIAQCFGSRNFDELRKTDYGTYLHRLEFWRWLRQLPELCFHGRFYRF